MRRNVVSFIFSFISFDDSQSLHESWKEEDVIAIAGRAETASEHPLGRAIMEHAAKRSNVAKACDNYEAIPGTMVMVMVIRC